MWVLLLLYELFFKPSFYGIIITGMKPQMSEIGNALHMMPLNAVDHSDSQGFGRIPLLQICFEFTVCIAHASWSLRNT